MSRSHHLCGYTAFGSCQFKSYPARLFIHQRVEDGIPFFLSTYKYVATDNTTIRSRDVGDVV